MAKQEKSADEARETPGSRFAYFGDEDDEALEGGVHAVNPAKSNAGARSSNGIRPAPASNGIPGPQERLLDISELVRTLGMHYVHRFVLPPGTEQDFEAVSPIEGEITLTNSGALLLIRGHVATTLRMECGRCLNTTDESVESDIEEEFDLITSHNAFQQEDVQAVDEDTPASVIKGNVLDLADLLRQNLLLAAPLQPLCREDCPGIVLEDSSVNSTTIIADDNPLRRLGELLEAKRKSAEGSAFPDSA